MNEMTFNTDIKPLQREKRGRRKLRSPNPEVRDRILEAAGSLILEKGFPNLRIDEIAERARISVGTFYLYFASRDEIFTSLVVQQTAVLRERMNRAMEGASKGERGERRLDAYFDFVEEIERGFLRFLRAGSMETTAGDLSAWAFAQHAQDLRPLLADLVGDTVDDHELELLVQANLAVTQHVVGYWLEHRDRFSRERIKAFLQKLTRALIVGLHAR